MELFVQLAPHTARAFGWMTVRFLFAVTLGFYIRQNLGSARHSQRYRLFFVPTAGNTNSQ